MAPVLAMDADLEREGCMNAVDEDTAKVDRDVFGEPVPLRLTSQQLAAQAPGGFPIFRRGRSDPFEGAVYDLDAIRSSKARDSES